MYKLGLWLSPYYAAILLESKFWYRNINKALLFTDLRTVGEN